MLPEAPTPERGTSEVPREVKKQALSFKERSEAAMSTAEGVEPKTGTFVVKAGLAQMLKGGIIMDVVNAEQARIAEEAGACAVMALEKVPADIRRDGGVARMADPKVCGCWFSILSAKVIINFAEGEADHESSDNPCHGKMQDRSFCRSPDPPVTWSRLH